jgi:hypothetical protein
MSSSGDWESFFGSLIDDDSFAEAFLQQLQRNSFGGYPDLDECTASAFDEAASQVLTFSWSGDTPLCSEGCTTVYECGGVYRATSTDWSPAGPFGSLEELVAQADSFNTGATYPELSGSGVDDDELIEIGERITAEGQSILIDGETYVKCDGNLLSKDEVEEWKAEKRKEEEEEEEEDDDEDDDDADEEDEEDA